MKLSTLASFGMAYQFKKLKLGYAPFFFWIEPTNFCNLRCATCPQSLGIKAERGYMELDLYKKVLDELKTFQPMMLSLHLGGESLLHKDLPEMIRLAKAQKMEVTLASNATLLTEEKARQLIDAGLDGITVNFSAFKDEFEKNFKGATWETVYANMRGFLELKKASGRPKPIFAIQLLKVGADSEGNRRELDRLFEGLPVDSIMEVDVHNWSGDFAESGEVDCGFKKDPSKYFPCSHLWSSMVIRWNGDVVPCCRDLQSGMILGNVRNASLQQLWNGPTLVEMRRKLRDREAEHIALCRNCSKLWEGTKPHHFLFKHLGKIPLMLKARLAGRKK